MEGGMSIIDVCEIAVVPVGEAATTRPWVLSEELRRTTRQSGHTRYGHDAERYGYMCRPYTHPNIELAI